MKYYVLYNPKSLSGKGLDRAKELEKQVDGICEYVDSTQITDFDAYVAGIPAEDKIVLCGGDGTLNYYINHTTEETRKHELGYFAAGTGNDFLFSLGLDKEKLVPDISKYLQKLPTVTVKGKKYLFLNGIGYGIDGYCCEEGDRLREISDKPVNYTSIAIKGLLFHFKPRTATVTIDGETKVYKYAWLVPTMKGTAYGGGMLPTPAQDRLAADGHVSVLTYCCKSALHALIIFPSIFKGEHLKNKKVIEVHTGNTVTVSFDVPCALQIDGDTVTGVSEYTVTTD